MLTSLRELKQEHAAALDKAEALIAKARTEGRDLTAAENKVIEAHLADLERIRATIKERESLNTLAPQFSNGMVLTGAKAGTSYSSERAAAELWRDEDSGRVIPVLRKDQSYAQAMSKGASLGFGFGDFIKALAVPSGNPEIQAALSESGGIATGDVTVPTILLPLLIDLMRAKTVCIQAGALTVPLESETVNIARISADPTPTWRSENAAVTAADPTFERVQFKPQSLAVVVKVSMELLEDSANINDAIMQCFAGAFAVELDRVGLFGTGVLPQPHGISGTSGVASVDLGTNGAALADYDPFIDAVNALLTANAAMPTAAIMAPRTLTKAAKLKDTLNQPLRRPDLIQDLPFLSTTSVPINQTHGTSNAASEAVVGDFTQLMIGIRHKLRIQVLRERFLADNGQIGFLADLRADIQLRHPQSFCEVVGIL
jgi:HK97 family phage major capsid protein